ncbi:MAG: SDR family oxidoreductase [Candidatus Marinimicrobia bacterium]|nr:SDR family oxidoreductase [Candidatus Neomarinimicrobiota bacterium]
MTTIDGKVCFVTGGANGIGKATALKLLAMGGKVFVLDLSPERIAVLEQECAGQELACAVGSVAREAEVAAAFATCRAIFGPVDILVNNAGIGIPTPNLAETDLAVFEQMVDVNFKGVFLASREALKDMQARKRGHILTVVSMAGQRTNPGAPAYCATKFAARGLSSGIADQAIKSGIKITDINPGPVDSDYWGDRDVPREKFLKPADVAEVIGFVVGCPDYMMVREINFDNLNFLVK